MLHESRKNAEAVGRPTNEQDMVHLNGVHILPLLSHLPSKKIP
jgi:hypothetical protein